MKKVIIAFLVVVVLVVIMSMFVYYNLPVIKVKHDLIGEISIIDFYCNNLPNPYEIVCQTGNEETDIQFFKIDKNQEFKGSVIINRSLENKMLVYVRDDKDYFKTYSFPDPGVERRGGKASSGRVYYLEWDNEKKQTDIEYFSVEIRELQQ